MARNLFLFYNGAMTEESRAIIDAVRAIPRGKTASYGAVARCAGRLGGFRPPNPRQVSRILHSCSEKYDLPWHRVVNTRGRISLPPGGGFEEQAALLRAEGVRVAASGAVDQGSFLSEIPTPGGLEKISSGD